MSETSFPKPINEDYRLIVLRDLGILDTEPAPEFDRLTRLASAHFGTMVAVVSLVDAERQWFKACYGLNATETDRRDAFCAHTIMGTDNMIVLVATKDGRFIDNPLVTGPPNIRFYAGSPLIIDGAGIGTFCIIDDKPRHDFGSEEKECLKAFAQIAMDEIRLADMSRTTRNPYVEKLRREQRRADAAVEAKAQFLAMMSHELRTPLNAVLGFAESISEELLGPIHPPKYREFAEHILEGGRRQLMLIERMLQLTEQGSIALIDEIIDLKDMVRHCVDALAGEALLAGVFLREEIPDKRIYLNADPVHIEQIVLELISNAMKASPRGEHVQVSITIDTGNAIKLSIRDAGEGIDEATMADVVGIFSQVSKGHERKSEGVGIGLPIVRKLTELHGATLALLPLDDCGTCAEVVFPAYRTASANALATRVS